MSKRRLFSATIIGLVALDLAVRALFWAFDEAYDSRAADEHVARTVAAMSPRDAAEDVDARDIVVHPYMGWEMRHRLAEMGSEIEYFQSPRSEPVFDLLVVGSSLGAAVANRGRAQLIAMLEASPLVSEERVRVFQFARGAHKQPQQLLALCRLLALGYEPDAVLSVGGFNEMAFGMANAERGSHPSYPAVDIWRPLVRGRDVGPEALDLLLDVRTAKRSAEWLGDVVERWPLTSSCIVGTLLKRRVDAVHAGWARAQEDYLQHLAAGEAAAMAGPSFSGDARAAVETAIDVWARCVRLLHTICEARGIPFVSVLQPNLNDVGSKLESEEESGYSAPEPWVRAAQLGYSRLREAGGRLREEGIACIDATRVFAQVTETRYVDNSHLNDTGVAELTELAARALLDELAGR